MSDYEVYMEKMDALRAAYRRIEHNEASREDKHLLFDAWINSGASNEWLLWSLLDTKEEPSEKEVELFLRRMKQIFVNDI